MHNNFLKIHIIAVVGRLKQHKVSKRSFELGDKKFRVIYTLISKEIRGAEHEYTMVGSPRSFDPQLNISCKRELNFGIETQSGFIQNVF